jgi:hypothetical protein
MENITQRTAYVIPACPDAFATTRALMLAGATVNDARTLDVRTVAREALVKGTGVSISGTPRVRATGITSTATGMRHTGFPALVPGSIAWSPPI